jgi:heme exporter protein B
MFRDARLIASRDLRIELRSKVAMWQVVPFALLSLILFAFAIGPNPALLQQTSPGLFWLALLFASVLGTQRSLSVEGDDATREATRLLDLDPAGIFLGKCLSLVVEFLVLEVVLLGGVLLLFHTHVTAWPLLVALLVLAPIGLAAASVIYGSVTTGLRSSATLLPLLVLPVLAPLLIAGARCFADATGSRGNSAEWLGVLAVFSGVYLLLGIVLYGPLEES